MMINKKVCVLSLLVTAVLLFVLAGCGSSAPEEATAVPPTEPSPTAEPAAPPTAVPAPSTGWSNDPVRVTTLGGDQAIPRIVTGDNGDFYVAWFSNPNGENYDMRMQRYDAGGNGQWGKTAV